MNLTETKISSKPIFEGKIMSVSVDTVLLPNGEQSFREILHHNGAVAVVPITDDGHVVLERQFRYAIGETLIEVPAGKLEKGEAPDVAALRELQEETGYTCRSLTPLGVMYGIPAYSSECVHAYLARGLKAGKTNLDADEFLDTFTVPLDKAIEWVMNGKITDAKTALLLLKVEKYLNNKED